MEDHDIPVFITADFSLYLWVLVFPQAIHVEVDERRTSDLPAKSLESLSRKDLLKIGTNVLVCSIKRLILKKLEEPVPKSLVMMLGSKFANKKPLFWQFSVYIKAYIKEERYFQLISRIEYTQKPSEAGKCVVLRRTPFTVLDGSHIGSYTWLHWCECPVFALVNDENKMPSWDGPRQTGKRKCSSVCAKLDRLDGFHEIFVLNTYWVTYFDFLERIPCCL